MHLNWTEFKTFASDYSLSMQWIVVGSNYHLTLLYGKLTYNCMIPTDETHADAAEFVADFKDDGNKIYNTDRVLNGVALSNTMTLTTSPAPLRVGGSNQVNRGAVMMMPSTNNARYSFNADGTHPYRLFKNQLETLNVGENVTVYLFTTSGSDSCVVTELSYEP